MHRPAIAALALFLLRADMYPDASNAKLPEAQFNLGHVPGAAGDGVADDTAALNAYLAAVPATGGIIRLDPGKKYRIAGALSLPANVVLDCQVQPGMRAGGAGTFQSLGGIRLDGAATLSLTNGNGFRNCVILPTGVSFPASPAAYAGTAVTAGLGSTDWVLDNVLMVGFETCLNALGSITRPNMDNVECDATNGYKFGAVMDTGKVGFLRTWPWGNVTSPLRTGTGLYINAGTAPPGQVSDFTIQKYTDFGHATGLRFDNAAGGACCGMYLANVWLDTNTNAAIVDAYGLVFGKLSITGATNTGLRLSNGYTSIAHLYVDGPAASGCVVFDPAPGNAQLYVGEHYIQSCGGVPYKLQSASNRLQVMQGTMFGNNGGAGPYVALDASIQSSDAAFVGGGSDQAILPSTAIVPRFSLGSGALAGAAGRTAPTLLVGGLGQATSALTSAGAMGGAILAKDTGGSAGNGSAYLFGARPDTSYFGAIKGLLSDGSSNTTGDIAISTRAAAANAALTERLRIGTTGVYVSGTFAVLPASPAAASACTAGQIVPDANFIYACSSSGVWKRAALTAY